jgi:phage baseplate assembly protein gpV
MLTTRTKSGVLEVDGNTVRIRGNLVVEGDLSVGGSITCAGQMITNPPVGPGPVPTVPFDE